MYNSNSPIISSLLIVDKLIKYKHIADDLQIKHNNYIDTFFFNSTSDPIVFSLYILPHFSEFHKLCLANSTSQQQLFDCDHIIKYKLLSLISMLSYNTLHFYILNHNSFDTNTRDFFLKFSYNMSRINVVLFSLLYDKNNIFFLDNLNTDIIDYFDKIKKAVETNNFIW
jgi:hypothetical protein